MVAMQEESSVAQTFKDTLNLPRTDYPIRPQAHIDDPVMLERWHKENLYENAYIKNKGNKKYIIHDGPPYANGSIHLGHAYNKILKDIIAKARRMMGMHVPVTPGWDCHGLPIEIKVSQNEPGLSALDLKKACRDYARHWVDIQRKEFQRLGIIMNWDHPYTTMAPHYEAATMRAVGVLFQKGFLERKNKTIAWCPSCRTGLASAEIEYKERKDPSIYVFFGLEQSLTDKLFAKVRSRTVNLLVWTTTPWTLPLNRAVMLNPHAMYELVEVNGTLIVAGEKRAEEIARGLGLVVNVLEKFSAKKIVGSFVEHPFISGLKIPVIEDQSVIVDEGTACVHVAPGCGPEDYEIGVKNRLEIYSPITPQGTYSQEIEPKELEGMTVSDGQGWVINKLSEKGKLFHKMSAIHSYPHCWRCYTGLIFRATRQWFFDLDKHGIKEKSVKALDDMLFIPAQGKNFLKATLENRWEWSLSRQRVWGVPIPALLCVHCDFVYTSADFINNVALHVEREGIEYWDTVEVGQLTSHPLVCAHCASTSFKKEHDILDVWFEAGISHFVVLYNNKDLAFPADLYVEGVDQHRGWFQSSLLTSLALEGESCTKGIMTHGFTVDAKGQKMSKSLGNGVEPKEIIDQLGTDGLRLWVASVGQEGDAVVSTRVLHNIGEVFRKIRNTCRFLLQNLYDFEQEKDLVPLDRLFMVDRVALAELSNFNKTVIYDYCKNDFTAVFHALADYCSSELSAFYLDIIKDRLYVEKADGNLRRSAQTVVWYMLDTLTRLMAPIMSFTAEQLSDYYQKNKKESIHLQNFVQLPNIWNLMDQDEGCLLAARCSLVDYFEGPLFEICSNNERHKMNTDFQIAWHLLKEIRGAVFKAVEVEREKGLIKHSLEAEITLFIDQSMKDYPLLKLFLASVEKMGQKKERFFKEFFIVSNVRLALNREEDLVMSAAIPGLYVMVNHAEGNKCPRCWNWAVSSHPLHLCDRCQSVFN
jgi:isoleucyl-tRNA synthetase